MPPRMGLGNFAACVSTKIPLLTVLGMKGGGVPPRKKLKTTLKDL